MFSLGLNHADGVRLRRRKGGEATVLYSTIVFSLCLAISGLQLPPTLSGDFSVPFLGICVEFT